MSDLDSVFFFKQKTAYEMRISDWSSDVCSSDLTRLNRRTLAILAGGLSVAVLGALMWSLQPQRRGANEQTELYNVDRVSKSEGLDALPADYSKLPPKEIGRASCRERVGQYV